jgi:hypothetical protein
MIVRPEKHHYIISTQRSSEPKNLVTNLRQKLVILSLVKQPAQTVHHQHNKEGGARFSLPETPLMPDRVRELPIDNDRGGARPKKGGNLVSLGGNPSY